MITVFLFFCLFKLSKKELKRSGGMAEFANEYFVYSRDTGLNLGTDRTHFLLLVRLNVCRVLYVD